MSKTNVKHKILDARSNSVKKSPWIRLAEDAERDAEKARLRSDQLTEAARIFRENAKSEVPWPTLLQTTTLNR